MLIQPEDVLKLLLAVVLGGLIGAEREFRDKAAGFRTIIFICGGACLFTIFSLKVGGESDGARIAAQIVSGVGFLGAGAILRDGARVMGLTTASTIWLTAALGMGVGSGQYGFTTLATGIILVVLWVFPKIEEWIDNTREVRTYETVNPVTLARLQQMEATFREHRLRVLGRKQANTGEQVTCTWEVLGSPRNHDRLRQALFADRDVRDFRVN